MHSIPLVKPESCLKYRGWLANSAWGRTLLKLLLYNTHANTEKGMPGPVRGAVSTSHRDTGDVTLGGETGG